MAVQNDKEWVPILEQMPYTQIKNLRDLTNKHLKVNNDESAAHFIKVVYTDRHEPPRMVLWEVHPHVNGLEIDVSFNESPSIRNLKKIIGGEIPTELRSLNPELYFATARLGEIYGGQEKLRQYLAIYNDKIYAIPTQDQSHESFTWTEYKKYFDRVRHMVLSDPTLYIALCRSLKSLFPTQGKQKIESDRLYQYLVLLRSLPESVASATTDHTIALTSADELLSLLQDLENRQDEIENGPTIYNVLNVLEWLVYLAPNMDNQETTEMSQRLHEAFVDRLVAYIVDDGYALAIQLEAAWCLGWTAIASLAIATRMCKMLPPSRIHTLKSTTLRHVAGTALLRASFTLANFGAVGISANAAPIHPGSNTIANTNNQSQDVPNEVHSTTSEVIYGVLRRITGSGDRIGLTIAVTLLSITLLWTVANVVMVYFLQPSDYKIGVRFLLLPTLLLLVSLILLAIQVSQKLSSRIRPLLTRIQRILGNFWGFLAVVTTAIGAISTIIYYLAILREIFRLVWEHIIQWFQ